MEALESSVAKLATVGDWPLVALIISISRRQSGKPIEPSPLSNNPGLGAYFQRS